METVLIAKAACAEEAWPLIGKVERFDTTAGIQRFEEMLAGSVYQVLELDGETVGAYALQMAHHENGSVVWVAAAAANVPGKDLSPGIYSIIEQQARRAGAAQIACTTKRRGLVKKLLGMGFEISGITLRKKL